MVVVISTYLFYGRWSFLLRLGSSCHTYPVRCTMHTHFSACTLPGDSPTPLGSSPLPLEIRFGYRGFFIFCEYFLGQPPAHHTAQYPREVVSYQYYATMEKSLLLSRVKPQDVVPGPHIKQYIVLCTGWVGFSAILLIVLSHLPPAFLPGPMRRGVTLITHTTGPLYSLCLCGSQEQSSIIEYNVKY